MNPQEHPILDADPMNPAIIFATDLVALMRFLASIGVAYTTLSVHGDDMFITLTCEADAAVHALFATLVRNGGTAIERPEFRGNTTNHWVTSCLKLGALEVRISGPHHAGGIGDEAKPLNVEFPRLMQEGGS